eukprot:391112-Amphidinium_carterae.1
MLLALTFIARTSVLNLLEYRMLAHSGTKLGQLALAGWGADGSEDKFDTELPEVGLQLYSASSVAAFSAVVAAAGPVAVSHPHLLGVDHHQ